MKALRYITAAAALVALAACTNDEVDVRNFATDPDAVRITASVGNPLTKSFPTEAIGAAKATQFDDGDQITVSVAGQETVTYEYTDLDKEWTPLEQKYLKWQTNKQTFTAYYPASYTGSGDVPTTQSTLDGIKAADFMKFSSELTKDGTNPISLTMVRQTARIVIDNITWNDQYGGTAPTHTVTGITINGITPYANGNKYYALVNPGEAKPNDTFITLTIAPNDASNTTPETLTIKGIPALAKGNSYTYSIAIGKKQATIASVEVAEWTAGSIINGEGITEEVTDSNNSNNEQP